MISLAKPADSTIEAFLADQARRELSYPEAGSSRDQPPAGYALDHNFVQLGEGRETFERARAAIRGWVMFPRPWTEIHPAGAPIEAGTVVAVLVHLFGLWWLNACRIVYGIDEPRRFGFAYGTLPGHAEKGEERFSVEWREDGTVWYDLLAFSRPRLWLARLGSPVTRRVQRRFARESKAAMQRAVPGISQQSARL
jgi:uncharacterized protein (UPF0548 family)